jgi:hypothetical protein
MNTQAPSDSAPSAAIPEWSGAFWLSHDGQTGYQTIANIDERLPGDFEVPDGFELEEVIDGGDCETWVWSRI